MRWALTAILLIIHGVVFANDTNKLQQSMDDARQQREQLSARIANIQKKINSQLKQRKTADAVLQKTESVISDLVRQLNDLEASQKKVDADLQDLKKQQEIASLELKQHQQQLAKQMQVQYKSRLSAWSVLLSGDDPNEIGRNLAYIEYIHRHQAMLVEQINVSIQQSKDLQIKTDAKQSELQDLIQSISNNKKSLEDQKQEHTKVLKSIDTDLKAQRSQSKVLEDDQNRLSELIQNIQVEIDVESKKKQIEQEKKIAQAQAKQNRSKASPSKKLLSAPAGSMLGLEKNLIKPVEGDVLGRFGASRPEGGVWRGIVIRSPQDTKVKAVAPGQVVYANWLAGFGNILIIDHGSQFLSVYAYNHSLLKQIGDKVAAKDIIATVGATGGQVEPGLYFEIRENGKPVNPILWLIQ